MFPPCITGGVFVFTGPRWSVSHCKSGSAVPQYYRYSSHKNHSCPQNFVQLCGYRLLNGSAALAHNLLVVGPVCLLRCSFTLSTMKKKKNEPMPPALGMCVACLHEPMEAVAKVKIKCKAGGSTSAGTWATIQHYTTEEDDEECWRCVYGNVCKDRVRALEIYTGALFKKRDTLSQTHWGTRRRGVAARVFGVTGS